MASTLGELFGSEGPLARSLDGSPDELIPSIIVRESQSLSAPESEEAVKKRLQGLGYLD